VPMERSFLPKVRRSFPDLPIIDTAAGIPLHEEPGNEQPGQAHEPDPHVWLSLRLARSLARSTCEALADVDPDHTPAFRGRLADLQADLAALDADIAQILKPVAGRELLVFHPAFGYFAADYGLDQVAIEAGGIEPTPKHLATLLQRARQQGQRVLFVQPEFGVSAAQKMAHQMGLEVVTLDPLARNYLGNLRDMALSIREALERK
jgi:zinc transport system substrate-binding protein